MAVGSAAAPLAPLPPPLALMLSQLKTARACGGRPRLTLVAAGSAAATLTPLPQLLALPLTQRAAHRGLGAAGAAFGSM